MTQDSILRTILFLMLLSPAVSNGQEKQYDISVAGIGIGGLTATRTEKDGLTYYDLKSEVKLWLLFRIEVLHHIKTVYRGDQLISSTSETHTNKGDFTASTVWDGSKYVVKIDAYEYKKDTLIAEPIHFNVGRMYFDKPAAGQKIYADNFGLLIPGVFKEDGVVVRILGNASTYRYRGNEMYDATMYHPVKNYRVKLVTPTAK